jgi:GMP synthase (glutamine-hydrolysing)
MIVDGVLILDFGSQYTQLIARRIREQHVYCEIPIILSGGPASVFAEGAPSVDPGVFDLGVPVLGICYGMQLASHLLGGKVEQADEREYGPARLEVLKPEGLLHGFHVGSHVDVWMSHGDRVESAQ